jgi:WD-40 repeat-containing protein
VKRRLNSVLLAIALFALIGCSADSPSNQTQLAVQGLYSAALSSNAKNALIGSIQHGGSYWSRAPSQRLFNWNHVQGEATPLISVDIDPSGRFAITGGARTLVLWDTQSGQSAGYWNTPGDIRDLKLTQNGDFALVGMNDQTARYFDVKNGGILQTLRTNAVVRAVDVTPDGRLAVTGDDLNNVTLWDLVSGEIKKKWTLSNNISSVAISDNGAYVFGAAQLGEAKVWQTVTGVDFSTIDTGALKGRNSTISKAIFSNDDRQLLLGSVNRRVKLANTATGQIEKEWDLYLKDALRPTAASVLALAFGSDTRYYAIGSNGYLNTLQ